MKKCWNILDKLSALLFRCESVYLGKSVDDHWLCLSLDQSAKSLVFH